MVDIDETVYIICPVITAAAPHAPDRVHGRLRGLDTKRHGDAEKTERTGKGSHQAMEPEKLSKLRIGQKDQTTIGGRRIKRILIAVIATAMLSAVGYLVS